MPGVRSYIVTPPTVVASQVALTQAVTRLAVPELVPAGPPSPRAMNQRTLCCPTSMAGGPDSWPHKGTLEAVLSGIERTFAVRG